MVTGIFEGWRKSFEIMSTLSTLSTLSDCTSYIYEAALSFEQLLTRIRELEQLIQKLEIRLNWLAKYYELTNLEFWKSIFIIIGNHFTPEGTKQLEQYAQQFIVGRLLFARYTDNEQFGCAAGGTIHVIASILAGAETPADQLTAPEGSFKREQQRAQAQAAVIERHPLRSNFPFIPFE